MPPDGSQIFFTEDRKIGRFGGFTIPSNAFGATASVRDRLTRVRQRSEFNDRTRQIIGACIEVHKQLGPGLLEGIYEACLCRELSLRGINWERQRAITVEYKGVPIDHGYRVDLIVENEVVVEIKAVDALLPIHGAQLVKYLRLMGLETGLLVNFNAMTLRDGLRRLSRNPKNFRSSDLL